MSRSVSIASIAAVTFVLFLPSLPAGAMAGRPGKYDGTYNVDVITEKGTCDRYHWRVLVANGHVSSPDADMIHVIGLVDGGGRVSLSFRGQSELARAGGRMRGPHGSGTWNSPTLSCGGIWQAQRQS